MAKEPLGAPSTFLNQLKQKPKNPFWRPAFHVRVFVGRKSLPPGCQAKDEGISDGAGPVYAAAMTFGDRPSEVFFFAAKNLGGGMPGDFM